MDYIQMYSLAHGHGIKDYLDMQDTMIMSILELLKNKKVATYQEWVKIMEQKL